MATLERELRVRKITSVMCAACLTPYERCLGDEPRDEDRVLGFGLEARAEPDAFELRTELLERVDRSGESIGVSFHAGMVPHEATHGVEYRGGLAGKITISGSCYVEASWALRARAAKTEPQSLPEHERFEE